MGTRAFLHNKILDLTARARRLVRVNYASVGIRPQDLPYAPSPDHFRAANQRLAKIDRQIQRRLQHLQGTWNESPIERVLNIVTGFYGINFVCTSIKNNTDAVSAVILIPIAQIIGISAKTFPTVFAAFGDLIVNQFHKFFKRNHATILPIAETIR